jgi:hypothetical protein
MNQNSRNVNRKLHYNTCNKLPSEKFSQCIVIWFLKNVFKKSVAMDKLIIKISILVLSIST